MPGPAPSRLSTQLRGLFNAPFALIAFRRAFPERQTRIGALRRLAYFEQLGLCYDKVKKNANTSIVLLLQQLETGEVHSRAQTKWLAKGLQDLPGRELGRLRSFHYFVVVRDPYSRVLSAFLDKFRHESFRKKHGEFPLTPDGFGAFLDWLGRGGLDRDAHWDLQTKLIVWPLTEFDTVIRFENFAEEMRQMLAQLDIAHDRQVLDDVFPQDTGKKTGASSKVELFYNDARRAAVRELFSTDFEALGYPV